ncbi:hypothetical protein [Streptomyces acidiscabies]|uniref:Uncharacterized protein n=1 Tax=Streptomyces acidiscabies TaxID=42234 RepID=A0A0L0KLL8_9ACTN|nr:hypothetical protein [Streptomyces acidiscabies]KND38485.1 hypothetical protein IQ63_07575 [Streptomyces acidiscabies]
MTAPRKKASAAQRKTPPTVAGGFEPLRFSSKAPTEERVVLFYIDDEPYTIPKFISKSLGFKAMHRARDVGMEIAVTEAMEELLGQEGYQALLGCPSISDEDWTQFQTTFRDLVFGKPEEQGKGRR